MSDFGLGNKIINESLLTETLHWHGLLGSDEMEWIQVAAGEYHSADGTWVVKQGKSNWRLITQGWTAGASKALWRAQDRASEIQRGNSSLNENGIAYRNEGKNSKCPIV